LKTTRSKEQTSLCCRTSSDRAARAKALLAVADGARFTDAARAAGRRSGDGVAQLVGRFNRGGLAALDARHAGGPAVVYGPAERERSLREFGRTPDRERDGKAIWSLTTLRGRCGRPRTGPGRTRPSRTTCPRRRTLPFGDRGAGSAP